ncbi:hypothetical protein LOS73_07410 [Pseudoalteromonas sp. SCSIO 43210]
MRLLIFLLALLSAFSVSAFEPDLSHLISPKQELNFCVTAFGYEGCSDKEDDAYLAACLTYIDNADVPPDTSDRKNYSLECGYKPQSGSKPVRITKFCIKQAYPPYGCTPSSTYSSITYGNLVNDIVYSCPPDHEPDYDINVPLSPVPTEGPTFMCAKPLDSEEPEKDPDCPEPTDNDPFVFGTGGSGSVCFPAPNGRQCEIKTDSNGGYYIPISYGSTEPAECVPDPEPEEPEEPDEPDDPDKPDNPDDPTPTPAPDEPEEPKEADDSDKTDILDAVNQVNDNLNVINDNMNIGIESNTERLDRVALEIQNSNELLSSVKANTLNIDDSATVIRDRIKESTDFLDGIKEGTKEGVDILDGIKEGQKEGIDLLDEIKENTEKEDFTITAGRKKGGLNDLFSDADLLLVKTEIEDKKTELTEYIETIQSESESILDLDPNISGSYTEHKEIIKGVEVDLGVGRFSNFYQMIAPAIILIASIAALFIILGSNKE